jgi:hypothetical protein
MQFHLDKKQVKTVKIFKDEVESKTLVF